MNQTPPAQPSPPVAGALRVFLSSTSVDLEPYRTRVASLVQSLGQFAVTMNGFPLQPSKDATTVSLDQLRTSQACILLLAWRYGHIPDGQANGQHLSVTHLEYREARRLGLPCFVFLADETTKDNLVQFPPEVRDVEQQEHLLAFRAEVSGQQLVQPFSSLEDLVDKVAGALHQYLLDLGRPGRIPRDLPPKVPRFVGRKDELAKLMTTLQQGQSVGLSALVAGLGGVGKSALASEALHRLSRDASAFPGGITFVRCDGRTGREGLAWVYDQVLAAWGLRLPSEALRGLSTPEEQVEVREQTLRERLGHLPEPALALLDNVELDFPLARTLDTLSPLGITLLVTARPMLSLPSLRLISLDVLAADVAVQLLRERYTDRGGTWDTLQDELPARTVVERLGWLPLAIELAAARAAVAGMGMLGLAHEVQQPDVLARLQDALAHEASVRYSLAQSLTLLTPAQRVRFAALGLPDGPNWPRPVIKALFDGVPPQTTRGVMAPPGAVAQSEVDLERLSALSLVTLFAASAPGILGALGTPIMPGESRVTRVRLHPLLRMLAAEEWSHQTEATQQAGRRGLLRGVQDWVEAHQMQDAETYTLLEADEALVVGALRDSVTSEEALIERAVEGAEAALRAVKDTVFALYSYLNDGGRWQVGVVVWELALRAAQATVQRGSEGAILINLANLISFLGDRAQAHRLYEQALAVSQEVGDHRSESAALGSLGDLARRLGDHARAHALYMQALALMRILGDQEGAGITLNNLGLLAYQQRDYAEARRSYKQTLDIAREVGDYAGESNTLGNLAELALTEGDLAQAREWLNAALPLARTSGNRHFLCFILIELAELARCEQDWEASWHWLGEALTLNQRLGSRENEANMLSAQARLVRDQGEREAARRLFAQALALFETLGDAFETARVRRELEALDASKHANHSDQAKSNRRRLWPWSRQKR